MAKAKRVFEIAKDLGVASKVIVTKCHAEGVPGINNHMSTVKIGLEQTIREWFVESDQDLGAAVATHTAVEVTEKIDVSKARRAKKRPAKEKTTKAKADESKDSKTATAVKPPKPKAVPPPTVQEVIPVEVDSSEIAKDDPAPQSNQVDIAAQSTAPTTEDTGTDTPDLPEKSTEPAQNQEEIAPRGLPNIPIRPKVVGPVGSKLGTPQDAVLKGPKVVRIEKADNIGPVPRRRPVSPAASGGAGGPGGPDTGRQPAQGMTPSRPNRGGGGVKSRGPANDTGKGPGKRRSLNTRRGRGGESTPQGPSKFSEQDMLELDARLNRSTGFLKQRRRHMRKQSEGGSTPAAIPAETGGKVEISEPITIKSFSAATGIKSGDIIKYLFNKGVMATINSAISTEAATEVAMEYDIDLIVKEVETAEQQILKDFEQREETDVRPRPPVVAVLGHVDHGKTSLLDRIREADVAAGEAGGITQHIGAYRASIRGSDGEIKTVVLLDTPGHEAFTSMRARGAGMTDLVILIVAADDGVMPQTIESINHAKAANVPIIVVLNKIDRPEATEDKINKIFGQLAEHGLNPTQWGGTTEVVKVSAINGTGITELIELLDYQAELLELKADYQGAARGTVIESEMKPGRGPVARALVQQGLLKVGDFIVTGRAYGRVRDLTNDHGQSITEAGPATPIELSGIDQIPDAGDKFYITDSLQKAEQVAKQLRERERNTQLATKSKLTLENFADQVAIGQVKELRVVLKADVQGSIDVLTKSLGELGNDEVKVKVLHSGVGGITESDVVLADASDAVVIGFHVVASARAKEIAEQHQVEVRTFKIIYEVIDSLTKALEGLLEPEIKREQVATVEVRQIFRVSKIGMAAGCLVTDGTVNRTAKVQVERDGVVVTEDRNIESLRRVKDDAKEVRAGTECGIRLEGFDDIKPGDVLTCYNVIKVSRKLEG